MRVCHYVLLVYRSNNISQNSNVSKQTCINLFKMVRNILNTLLLFGRNAHNGPIHDMPCLYSRVGYKSRGWEQNSTKKGGKILGQLHLPDRTAHLQTGRGDYPDKT